jgi:two-component system response regulator (stage 0 sporulation protein A)
MEKKRILIADANDEFRSVLCMVLGMEEGLCVVGATGDGLEAIDLARELVPDVIVLDLVLDLADGFEVLDALADLPTRSLILSAFVRKNLAQQIADRGGDYYMMKPCRFSSVIQRVRLLAEQGWADHLLPKAAPTVSQQTLERTISDLLREIGVPANIRGHGYLRDAVIQSIQEPNSLMAITKLLYPDIAQKHGTTAARVERAIRHAIEVAWSRGDLGALQRYFGGIVSAAKGRPTNAECIATLAERVRLGEGVPTRA